MRRAISFLLLALVLVAAGAGAAVGATQASSGAPLSQAVTNTLGRQLHRSPLREDPAGQPGRPSRLPGARQARRLRAERLAPDLHRGHRHQRVPECDRERVTRSLPPHPLQPAEPGRRRGRPGAHLPPLLQQGHRCAEVRIDHDHDPLPGWAVGQAHLRRGRELRLELRGNDSDRQPLPRHLGRRHLPTGHPAGQIQDRRRSHVRGFPWSKAARPPASTLPVTEHPTGSPVRRAPGPPRRQPGRSGP